MKTYPSDQIGDIDSKVLSKVFADATELIAARKCRAQRQAEKPADPQAGSKTPSPDTMRLPTIESVLAEEFDHALDDADVTEKAYLRVAQRLLRQDRGCDTPIASFFNSLMIWGLDRPLKLRDVERAMETLRDDWKTAVMTARDFVRDHPEELGLDKESE